MDTSWIKQLLTTLNRQHSQYTQISIYVCDELNKELIASIFDKDCVLFQNFSIFSGCTLLSPDTSIFIKPVKNAKHNNKIRLTVNHGFG